MPNRRAIPDAEEPNVVSRYWLGETLEEIADSYGVSFGAIRSCLIRNGVELRKRSWKADGRLAEICESYNSGVSPVVIGKTHGLSEGAVRNCLSRVGVKFRSGLETSRLGSAVNYHAFDGLGSGGEADYYAGLIASDGCIDSREHGKKRIRLYLHRDDLTTIEGFSRFVGRPGGIRKGVGNLLGITVYSKEMYNALVANGITPRKTFTIEVSESLADSADFWRGAIDGDGCLGMRKIGIPYCCLTSASKTFAIQFAVRKKTHRLEG